MEGRSAGPAKTPPVRLEVLKELQQLAESREARDRLDKGPLSEVKGREHWVLHLLLRAEESAQAREERLIATAHANQLARLQTVDDKLAQILEGSGSLRNDLESRLAALTGGVTDRLEKGFSVGTKQAADVVADRVAQELEARWKPIRESIERFSEGSKALLKDVNDTYLVATQNRLLLSETSRRIAELARDLLALEDGLRLVIQRTIEESLAPLEARLTQLEGGAPAGGEPAPASGNGRPNEGRGAP